MMTCWRATVSTVLFVPVLATGCDDGALVGDSLFVVYDPGPYLRAFHVAAPRSLEGDPTPR